MAQRARLNANPLSTSPSKADPEGDVEEPPGKRRPRRSNLRAEPTRRPAVLVETVPQPELPALQFVVPPVAYAPEVIVEPRPRLRRLPRRLTDLSAVEVVVLYSVALNLERGGPEDLLAEEETADVAHAVAEALEGEVGAVHQVPVWDDVVTAIRPFDPHRHMVFNLVESLEGRPFTEPEVPRVLRSLGFTHTGGSYRALRRGNNKLSTKRTVAAAGLHTPRAQVFHRLSGRKVDVPLPAIVKPIAEGGSMGVTQASLAHTPEELLARVDYCLETYHQPALAEEYIAGREINAALWGNGVPEILPLSEITFPWTKDPCRQFVTFQAKWVKTSVEYKRTPALCPAPLTAQEQVDIEAAARKAYQLIGVKGFARVDIRLRDGIPYILEVNVNPDLSPDAGFYRSASAAGHTYRSMILHIVKMALDAAP